MSHSSSTPSPLTAAAAPALKGRVRVPGDKSISHRSILFGALAVGQTEVRGLLEGEDVLGTAAAMRAYGATVTRVGEGHWTVNGVGVGGFAAPDNVIDLGNSGTSARLIAGLAASNPVLSIFTGDGSLRKRPMKRVTDPLTEMGAQFIAREGGRLPLVIQGRADLTPISYRLPVPSAQVKSAILLAGLNTIGATTVIEEEATRDHTEKMLRHFGAQVDVTEEGSDTTITIQGRPELSPAQITVPTDPSSAAFPLVAALVVPGSEVCIEAVGLNPLRTGLITTLIEMGGDITIENQREEGGEPVGDLIVRHSRLKGIKVPADRAPSMIDEYPVLSVAAAFAEGDTEMVGLAELRVKESDRLAAVAAGLKVNGVTHVEGDDWLTVTGSEAPLGGGTVETHLDHRLAMAFSVLGLASQKPVTVDDRAPINTSFPSYLGLMQGLGAVWS